MKEGLEETLREDDGDRDELAEYVIDEVAVTDAGGLLPADDSWAVAEDKELARGDDAIVGLGDSIDSCDTDADGSSEGLDEATYVLVTVKSADSDRSGDAMQVALRV